jgi:hypothetical protein
MRRSLRVAAVRVSSRLLRTTGRITSRRNISVGGSAIPLFTLLNPLLPPSESLANTPFSRAYIVNRTELLVNKIVITSETQHRAGKNAAAMADSLVCIKAGNARSRLSDTERGYAVASGKEAAGFHAAPDDLALAKRRIAAVGIGKGCPVGASRSRVVSGGELAKGRRVAGELPIRGAQKPLRILCAEFQISSADHVPGQAGQVGGR